MNDRTHNDLNAKIRAIIDDAIAELYLVGLESRSSAATLMAIQATIRIEDPKDVESFAQFVAEWAEPTTD